MDNKKPNALINRIIWIDEKINNKENKIYQSEFKRIFPNIKFEFLSSFTEYTDTNLKEKLYFEPYIIIISGGYYYKLIESPGVSEYYIPKNNCRYKFERFNWSLLCPPFIPFMFLGLFLTFDNKFFQNWNTTLPILLIFSSVDFKQKNPTLKNVFTNFEQIINFIKSSNDKINSKLKLYPVNVNQSFNYDNLFTFEVIESNEELILPAIYSEINKEVVEINTDDILTFNEYILKNCFQKDLGNLIFPLLFFKDTNILRNVHYWLMAYSLESNFYKKMNNSFMKDINNNEFSIFLKVLYDNLRKGSLYTNLSKTLFRCSKITKNEFDKIKEAFQRGKKVLYYSKTFLSFSKKYSQAEKFLSKSSESSSVYSIIYELESCYFDYSYFKPSNIDLEGTSFFPKEKEVLFLPFSFFVISEIGEGIIKDGIKAKSIKLSYLGKYSKEIVKEIQNIDDIQKFIKEREMGKSLVNTILLKKLEQNFNNEKKVELKVTMFDKIKEVVGQIFTDIKKTEWQKYHKQKYHPIKEEPCMSSAK